MRRPSDAGVSAVEVVFLTPVLMLMVMIIVGLGVLVNTSGVVDGAARDAARAGSVQGDTAAKGPQSVGAARESARADLGSRCTGGLADADIETDFIPPAGTATATFTPIAYFKVTIHCRLDMTGISMFGMFGARKTIDASFIAPVNTLQVGSGAAP